MDETEMMKRFVSSSTGAARAVPLS